MKCQCQLQSTVHKFPIISIRVCAHNVFWRVFLARLSRLKRPKIRPQNSSQNASIDFNRKNVCTHLTTKRTLTLHTSTCVVCTYPKKVHVCPDRTNIMSLQIWVTTHLKKYFRPCTRHNTVCQFSLECSFKEVLQD